MTTTVFDMSDGLALTAGIIDDPDVVYGALSICSKDELEKVRKSAEDQQLCWFDTDANPQIRIVFTDTEQVRDMIRHLSGLLTTMLLDENTALKPHERDGRPFAYVLSDEGE